MTRQDGRAWIPRLSGPAGRISTQSGSEVIIRGVSRENTTPGIGTGEESGGGKTPAPSAELSETCLIKRRPKSVLKGQSAGDHKQYRWPGRRYS